MKPDDWNEDAPAQIRDTNAVMPQGWLEDEPAMIPGIKQLIPILFYSILCNNRYKLSIRSKCY